MKKKISLSVLIVSTAVLVLVGCGAGANLAGLSTQIDVAQKGKIVAVTASATTNSVTVGASYTQGTNSISDVTTIPTGK